MVGKALTLTVSGNPSLVQRQFLSLLGLTTVKKERQGAGLWWPPWLCVCGSCWFKSSAWAVQKCGRKEDERDADSREHFCVFACISFGLLALHCQFLLGSMALFELGRGRKGKKPEAGGTEYGRCFGLHCSCFGLLIDDSPGRPRFLSTGGRSAEAFWGRIVCAYYHAPLHPVLQEVLASASKQQQQQQPPPHGHATTNKAASPSKQGPNTQAPPQVPAATPTPVVQQQWYPCSSRSLSRSEATVVQQQGTIALVDR
eukprot:scaffold17481_cov20-Tisochrysis_lutea.AAC.1